MGIVHPGIPLPFTKLVCEKFGLACFVETGTYHGSTALWASSNFDRVWTIEAYEPLYRKAVQTFASHANVQVVLGNSAEQLESVVSQLSKPAMFWLDGHYSGEGTGGAGFECPVLEEIAIIDRSPHAHFIMIDDARMFLAPPKRPHKPEHWPDMPKLVTSLLQHRPNDFVMIHEDVIYRIPAANREEFVALFQESRLD